MTAMDIAIEKRQTNIIKFLRNPPKVSMLYHAPSPGSSSSIVNQPTTSATGCKQLLAVPRDTIFFRRSPRSRSCRRYQPPITPRSFKRHRSLSPNRALDRESSIISSYVINNIVLTYKGLIIIL